MGWGGGLSWKWGQALLRQPSGSSLRCPEGGRPDPDRAAVRGAEGPRGPRSPEQLCLREQSRGAGQETGTLTAERLPEAVSAVM